MDLAHSCSDSGGRDAADAGDDGGAEGSQCESGYGDVSCELVDLIGHGPMGPSLTRCGTWPPQVPEYAGLRSLVSIASVEAVSCTAQIKKNRKP